MKILIPVAGIGSKLRPHTHTQPKALVPVAGKPILSHIIDTLAEKGYRDFIFIVGYLGDKIEEFIQTRYPNLNSEFVVQAPREGTGEAVWLARKHISGDEPLLIVLGDTIIEFDLEKVIEGEGNSLGVKRVDDPRNFGVAEVDEDGFIIRLSEKPRIPVSNMALVGVYYFKDPKPLIETLDEIIKMNLKVNDEYNLTDAIMRMIRNGNKVRYFDVGNWYDCGSRESLLETNAILLKRESDSHKVMNYHNTIIIHPVSISPECDISDSIIGPNVSIGDHAKIRSSIVSDSIIGSYSQLETAVLHHSVVGSDSILKGISQSLNIGDSTEIDFS
jgi:glucose-1-phosphate thymidylyltransferase